LVGHEIAHALGATESATESAADAAGLALAFRAYRLSVKGKPDIVSGQTGEQRFFAARARMWRSVDRPEYARSMAAGLYVPGRDRANRAAASVDAFYETFGVRSGDRMYRPPAERVSLW
jgi:putative endopeptidase